MEVPHVFWGLRLELFTTKIPRGSDVVPKPRRAEGGGANRSERRGL